MKKRFLLISMFAAAMLATSCSKDDNGAIQTVEPQPVTIQVQKTYPITVKATKKSSVSKISLGSDGYSELFDKDDKLVLTWGTDVSVELPLTSGDGTTSATFSGEIPVTAEGQDITAHIGSPIDATTQLDYESLEEAVKNVCYLVSHESFTYTAGADIPQITLDDQNSYLHFKLASTQLKFDLNIDGTDHTFSSFDANNEVWIVVPGGKTIKGNLISVSGKSLDAAKVYTVDRTDVVDFGLESGVLWGIYNLGSTSLSDAGEAYVWGETSVRSGDYPVTSPSDYTGDTDLPLENDAAAVVLNVGGKEGYRMPSQSEFREIWAWLIPSNGTVSNEYGSISFPQPGGWALIWTSTIEPEKKVGIYAAICSSTPSYSGTAYSRAANEPGWRQNVRPVRILN